jgi:hypothetical protein
MAETYGTRPSELLKSWPAFCLDEALFVKLALHRDSLSEQDGASSFRPDGYDPPARDELVHIPWQGEGPDPLAGTGAAL